MNAVFQNGVGHFLNISFFVVVKKCRNLALNCAEKWYIGPWTCYTPFIFMGQTPKQALDKKSSRTRRTKLVLILFRGISFHRQESA